MNNYYADNWMNLDWSEWYSLDPKQGEFSKFSTRPGLYRIRNKERGGLEYIGETGAGIRGRIRNHTACYRESRPSNWPASRLWEIRREFGPSFQVSYATPPSAKHLKQRCGMEAALIALYRKEEKQSPTGNFGPRSQDSIEPFPWTEPEKILSDKWMGLEWSEPEPLEETRDLPPPHIKSIPAQPGVYRIWKDGQVPPLERIGQAFRLKRRLQTHGRNMELDLLFSYARIYRDQGGYTDHKRKEIETDIIGAHWLACGDSPQQLFHQSCQR